MITKTDLKNYNFPNIEFYFDYVMESLVNSQISQVRGLVEAMSQRQRNHFYWYLDNVCSFHQSYINKVREISFNKN